VSVISGWLDCFVCRRRITLEIIGLQLDFKGIFEIILTLSTGA
jgi:hypothetical protein